MRVLDLCTGTGCIPLLFRHEFTERRKDVGLRTLGIDVSDKSVRLARHNYEQLAKRTETQSGPTDFAKADILINPFADRVVGAPLPLKYVLNHNRWSPFWDILISNPPYISPSAYWKTTTRSVRLFEPKLALVPPAITKLDDTAQGDLFYPRLLAIAQEVEAKIVLLEVADMEQAIRVAQHARNMDHFDGIMIWRDEPDANPEQPTTEDGFEVQGAGNARSVVCWRGVGGPWLGKPEASKTVELETQADSEVKRISFWLPPPVERQFPLKRPRAAGHNRFRVQWDR